MIVQVFYISYSIVLLNGVDASGRFASGEPAFLLADGVIGLALGGRLIGSHPFVALAAIATTLILIGAVLFAIVAAFEKRNPNLRTRTISL